MTRQVTDHGMTLSRLDFLYRSGLDPVTLEVWVRAEWLVPALSEDEPVFSEADLARAQLISDLRTDLGVNDEGIGVILNLVDQVHGLRRAMAGMIDVAKGRVTVPRNDSE